MQKTSCVHAADLLGFSRLAVDGTRRLTSLIEAMHHTIAGAPGILGPPVPGTAAGVAGVVYQSVQAVTALVGGGMEAIATQLIPMPGERPSTPQRDAMLAALNGVMGDYLAATENPLAISMCLRRKGRTLTLETPALAAAIPRPTGKLVMLVHGLCLNDRQWTRKGHNHGTALSRDLGYTAVQLQYNSGLHISTNGKALANLIEELLSQWPVPVKKFAIVAHSMGGLVSRSACHYGMAAGHRWPGRLGTLIFLGTPHHGAPLERLGHWVDSLLQVSPYTSPLARIGRVRSAGITDLRCGNLLDDDWEGRDRFGHSNDRPRTVPLPEGVRCCAIAGTTATEAPRVDRRLPGDGLVPVDSALGRHPDSGRSLSLAGSRQWIGYGTNHWDLLQRRAVYQRIEQWIAGRDG